MRKGISRLQRAEEKALRKQIEETFGKDIARRGVISHVEVEDLRPEERKHLVETIRKELKDQGIDVDE
jgi:hypothetical protein